MLHVLTARRSSGASPRRTAERGLSLVEVQLGISLLVTAILGLSTVSVHCSNIHHSLTEKRAAVETIDEQVQWILSTPFADLSGHHDGRVFEVYSDHWNDLLEPSDPQAWAPGSITVSDPPAPASNADLLQVDVEIAWRGRQGNQRLSRSLLISRLGAG